MRESLLSHSSLVLERRSLRLVIRRVPSIHHNRPQLAYVLDHHLAQHSYNNNNTQHQAPPGTRRNQPPPPPALYLLGVSELATSIEVNWTLRNWRMRFIAFLSFFEHAIARAVFRVYFNVAG